LGRDSKETDVDIQRLWDVREKAGSRMLSMKIDVVIAKDPTLQETKVGNAEDLRKREGEKERER
jgi:hypothetical protein